jgi:4-amino-4-deoxy-L-arabinose transferase-like glycosyltransferase
VQRVWVYLLLALGVGLFGRVAGPSDLYDNDQPKTVAYTVDMVEHGRWLLPRDMLGNPATKPPLFNWAGAPLLAAVGPSEFVLKLPSVIGGLIVVGLTIGMGRRLMGGSGSVPALEVGVVAGLLWLASSAGMKHIYLARPDMVLAAALTGAWACATLCLSGQAASRTAQVGLWLCIALAALAKGPPALLGLLFVVLGAKLLTGRWASVWRTGIAWGLPLALLIVGGWVYAAYSADPAGFRAGMLSDTIEHRSTAGGFGSTLVAVLVSLWKMPLQFIGRFLPWSIFVVLTLIHIPPRRWFSSTLGPAVLWVLLAVGFFMLSPRQRPDYLLPAFGRPPSSRPTGFWWSAPSTA